MTTIPTVAVTADRRRDEQALLLERHGLQVAMYPLVQTVPAKGDALGTGAWTLLEEMTGQLVNNPPNYLVANTGYGMRSWFSLARDRLLLDGLVAALSARTTIVARGAKALGELRKVGLDAEYKAPDETMAEIAAYLSHNGAAGSKVAVQLHGDPAGSLEELRGLGAELLAIPVYSMSATSDDIPRQLATDITLGALGAVTFTAAPQLQVLAASCRQAGTWDAVLAAFNDGAVVAACIGEVCAARALTEGVTDPLVPPHPRLASLAGAVAARLLA
ncbi:MAG TPA: uroporphyrinogen-III synthase [Acidimicrobiales bacterium]|nr:uroporphyrinogen-III synthase [Acidimicrobiales bacterium]